MGALAGILCVVGRMAGTLLGLALLTAAFAAEFDQDLVAAAIGQAPAYARQIVETALARENVLHTAAAVLAGCGLIITVSSWPLLLAGVIFLMRACISAIGAVLIVAAIVLAIDPSFLGLLTEVAPPVIEDEEGGGGGEVLVQAAAALLALFGLALAAAPWRRDGPAA